MIQWVASAAYPGIKVRGHALLWSKRGNNPEWVQVKELGVSFASGVVWRGFGHGHDKKGELHCEPLPVQCSPLGCDKRDGETRYSESRILHGTHRRSFDKVKV